MCILRKKRKTTDGKLRKGNKRGDPMSRFVIIKGLVENLRIMKGFEDFVFIQSTKNASGMGAVAAGLLGQSSASITLSSSSSGGEIDMEYFTCTVNEKILKGGFHKVNFKDGELVEFVARIDSEVFSVHAARSDSQRILWMLPYQGRGYKANRVSDIKWTLILSLFSVFAAQLIIIMAVDEYMTMPIFYQLLTLGMIFATVVAVNIFARSRFTDFAKEATDVFGALGFENPSEIDLYQIHKEAEKKLRQETNSLPPLVATLSFRF